MMDLGVFDKQRWSESQKERAWQDTPCYRKSLQTSIGQEAGMYAMIIKRRTVS